MDDEELLKIINNAAEKELTELDLSDNQLTQLPPEIVKLTNLTKLDLSQNQLTQLSPEIGKLTNLTELYLFDNQLTQLPPEIGKLAKLAILNLPQNQLIQLSPEIGKLTNLTHLNLSQNQLTQLPPEIGRLTKLHWLGLDLGNNKLDIPNKILKKKNPQKIIPYILFANYRESQIVDNELLVSIATQRNLKKSEFRKITEWLKAFGVRAFFMVDKDNPDIKLPVKSEAALENIKQYLTNELFINHKESRIIDGELFVSIITQRNLKESEHTKITDWLNTFRIRAYFAVDKDNPGIKLSKKNEDAVHEIKQYLSNKYQDHISQVYDRKTQDEKICLK